MQAVQQVHVMSAWSSLLSPAQTFVASPWWLVEQQQHHIVAALLNLRLQCVGPVLDECAHVYAGHEMMPIC